jgi:hypothetical protein
VALIENINLQFIYEINSKINLSFVSIHQLLRHQIINNKVMNCATFFGEVNELSSRAIWWSDSDSDDNDLEEEHQNSGPKVAFNTKDVINCDSIDISLAKNDKIMAQDLDKIGFIGIDGINGVMAYIYAINKSSIWLQLNANYPTLKNHLVVKTIANLMKELFIRCQSISDQSLKPMVRIISKDLIPNIESNDVINYLSNNSNNLINFPQNVEHKPLIAPKVLSNLIESSIFEYCTLHSISCIALILSDFQSINLTNNFISKQILTTIQQFNDFSNSNIFT